MQRGQKPKDVKRGFTLFEVILVIALIGILTSVTVANYRGFEKKLELENLAQDVAFSVKLAQSYGLNVRGEGGGGQFEVSYGINFNEATPTRYFIYQDADRSVNGYEYDALNGGVQLEVFDLGSGFSVMDVCLVDSGGADTDCFSTNEVDVVDVAFDRPKPDAHFVGTGSAGGTNYQEAIITLQSPTGVTRNISILSTGFVSVQ